MPDTLLFLNGRTNSSRWLPNSYFNSTIEIHSVRKDVDIVGKKPLLEDQYHLYLSGFHGGISPVKRATGFCQTGCKGTRGER